MESKKTNEQLVAAIQSGTDVQENMALLYENLKELIYWLALKAPKHNTLEIQDYVQEAYFALDYAAKHYTHMENSVFKTYAFRCIWGHLITFFYKTTGTNYKTRKYVAFKMAFREKHGRVPTEQEVMEHFNFSERTLKLLTNGELLSCASSTDSIISGTDKLTDALRVADDFNLEDFVVDSVFSEQQKNVLWGCVSRLEERQTAVIRDYFRENKSLEEIAAESKLSFQRVSRLKDSALLQLRDMDELKSLSAEFDYYSESLKGTGFRRWKETWESSVERAVLRKIEWQNTNDSINKQFESEVGVPITRAVKHFKQLDEKKERFLYFRYVEYKKIEEIAGIMSISESYACRLRKAALQDLKEILGA